MLFILLGIILIALMFILLGGGFGRKEANLKFPGKQTVLLFAHRGSGIYYPENSIEAFEAAMNSGFKAIETDIRLSSDKSLVIFHDDNCERLLGMDTSVSELPEDILRQQHILYNGKASTSTVLSLEDLFSTMKDKLVIYLDVKMHDFHSAGHITALIIKHHLESTTLVANSNMLFIAWIELVHPEINTVLEGFSPGKEWIYTMMPKNFKPDFLASFASDVNESHMDWFRSNGLEDRKIVYGVDKENFQPTIHAGVQKIIMDYDSTLQDEIAKYR